MSLPISSIVKVNTRIAPKPTGHGVCSVGLIVGESTVIGADERCREYTNINAVLKDFPVENDQEKAEYTAAKMYFAQKPAPDKLVIGRYAKAGSVLDGETADANLLGAVKACLVAEPDVYGVYVTGTALSTADLVSIAEHFDTEDEYMLFCDTTEGSVLSDTVTPPDRLVAFAGKKNVICLYSKQEYAGAALMGIAMAMENGADNSAFTLMYKTLSMVDAEDLTEEQYEALKDKGGNVVVKHGKNYSFLEPGRCVDKTPYDQRMYMVVTKRLLNAAVVDVLGGNSPKRPQTEDGLAAVIAKVNEALEKVHAIGFVAPGIWTGADVKELKNGDMLTNGFRVYHDSFDEMTEEDRAMRKAPTIYCCLKTAGAIESVVINLDVNL